MKKNSNSLRAVIGRYPFKRGLGCALVAAMLPAVSPLLGQSTWTGLGGDDLWTTSANWATPPANDGTANVVFAGSTRTSPIIPNPRSVNRVVFASGAAAFNVGASGTGTLTLASQGSNNADAALSNNSSQLQTISATINFLTANRSYHLYADSGGFLLSGDVAMTNQRLIINNNTTAQNVEISGKVSGTGSSGSLLVNSTFQGVLTLSGANDYTGALDVRRGTVVAKNNSALGASSAAVNLGGTSNFTNPIALLIGGAYSISNNIKTFNQTTGAVTLGGNTADASVYSGTVTLGDTAGKAISLSATAGGTVTFSGNILTSSSGVDDNDAVTKTGLGKVILTGAANTYSGATTVSEGTLLINGGYSVAGQGFSVASGAVLGGTGTINRAVTVNSGGTLLAGDGASASGILTIEGNLSLADGSIIQLILGAGGASSSLERAGGTWSFDADQLFTLNAGAAPGLYQNVITELTGTEIGLDTIASWSVANPQYTGSSFTFDAVSGSVNLYLVPEPSAFWLLALASLGVVLLRRPRALPSR